METSFFAKISCEWMVWVYRWNALAFAILELPSYYSAILLCVLDLRRWCRRRSRTRRHLCRLWSLFVCFEFQTGLQGSIISAVSVFDNEKNCSCRSFCLFRKLAEEICLSNQVRSRHSSTWSCSIWASQSSIDSFLTIATGSLNLIPS